MTIEEIYQRLAADFQARTGRSAGASSDLAVRFYAVAAQIYSLYVQGEWTRRQCFPQTAQGNYLDKHAQLRGVTRRQAAKAEGTVRFAVDQVQESTVDIPAGTVCMTAGGVRFVTACDAAVEKGELYADVPVEAAQGGAAGNVDAGVIVYMSVPPVRIAACVNTEPTAGGTDEESDEELRVRVLETYHRLANGANSAFYEQAAMSFDEVAAVTVIPRSRGVGTVDVIPASLAGMPSQELLDKLQAHFDKVREIAVDVRVYAPTPRTVDLALTLWPQEGRDFDQVAQAVRETLMAWFTGERLGDPLPRARLISLAFAVDGVKNVAFTQPAADLNLNNVTLPVLGELTVTRGKEG